MSEIGAAWPALAAVAVAAGMVGLSGTQPQAAPVSAPGRPAPVPPPMPSPPAAAAVPAVSAEGLVLYGVSGGGPAGKAAIIGRASGFPRVVPVGSDYRPGLTVREVGLTYALLVSGPQETRLELIRSAGVAEPGPAEAPATPSSSAPGAMDVVALRLGLRPHKEGGSVVGFRIKEGGDLPLLHRAGLRPGDVIVAVNGQSFDSEEKLIELPQEIAGSYAAEFAFDRDGRRMKTSLAVNPRPK